jgi:ubiquinone/menaquinone biosynthesis C-methylase UbiE
MTSNWQALTSEWLDVHHLAKLPERKQMIVDLEIEPNSLILDAGCGTGAFTSLLVEPITELRTVIGVDVNYSHIVYAGQHLSNKGCSFVCGDLSNLPFDKCFDLVWCANSLQYFSDPRQILQNFVHVTKQGGKIVVKDEDVGRDILLSWEPSFELDIINAWYNITKKMTDRYWDPFMGRKLVGLFHTLSLKDIKVKTYLIERVYPVSNEVKDYVTKAFWHYRELYHAELSTKAWDTFQDLFNPQSPQYLFTQKGFHFLSTETIVSGIVM